MLLSLRSSACSGELQSQQNLRALLNRVVSVIHSNLRSPGKQPHYSTRYLNFPQLLLEHLLSTSSSRQSTEFNASSVIGSLTTTCPFPQSCQRTNHGKPSSRYLSPVCQAFSNQVPIQPIFYFTYNSNWHSPFKFIKCYCIHNPLYLKKKKVSSSEL